MPNGDPCRGVVKTLAAPLEFLNAEFDGDPRGEVVKTLAAPLEFLKAEFGGDPRRGVVETLGGEMCVITGQGSHQSRSDGGGGGSELVTMVVHHMHYKYFVLKIYMIHFFFLRGVYINKSRSER
ncbi:hypothetical protein BVRB_8g191560 isoform A [Beta vulgaris subsp. vulgaris]|nr:hypothetical protein BVRB_8g191560 isoform A [Beta vulgaris subsp. vulgaris]